MRLNIIRGACALAAATTALLTRGAEINFPNVDGSGDLASPAAWGTAAIPAATDRPNFTNTMNVTAHADAAFAGLALTKAGISVTIDLTNAASQATAENPRRMTLSGYVTLTNTKNKTLRITGGVWDFLSTGGFTTYGSYGQSSGNKFYFEDCLVTNVLEMKAGYGDGDVVYSIGRGAKVYTRMAGACGYQAARGLLEVKDGGALYVNTRTKNDQNDFNLCNSGMTSPGNVIRVTGAGSVLDVTGSTSINMPGGGNPIGELFHVTDHAYAALRTDEYKTLGGGRVAPTETTKNRWVIDDGGVLYTCGAAINVAQSGGSSGGTGGAQILVGDGGVYTNACPINLGSSYACGAFAELCISNGFYRGNFPVIGQASAASSNCGVRITGPRARVQFTNTGTFDFFAKGANCYFILDDHAAVTNDGCDLEFNTSVTPYTDVGSNQLFAVCGGARYVTTNKLQISGINYRSWYNTIRVCDGGTLECGKLSTSSIGNTLAVSNGTIRTKGSLEWCYKSQSNYIYGFSNCFVRVQGATPRLDVGSAFAVGYQSTLVYELTPAGYADGYVPLTAQTVSVPAGCRLRVTGLDPLYRANGRKRRVYTLATATDGITLGAGVLAEANAALAADAVLATRSRLELAESGTRLNLVVSGVAGMTITVR